MVALGSAQQLGMGTDVNKHELKDRVSVHFSALILLISISPMALAISTGYTKIQPPNSSTLTLISLATELKPITPKPKQQSNNGKSIAATKPNQTPAQNPALPNEQEARRAKLRQQAWLKIQFAPGSAWLHPKYSNAIDAIAEQLAELEKNSHLKAVIEGSVGTGVSNEIAKKLSAARANVLREAILARNANLASRLEIRALGVAGDYKNGKVQVNEASQAATLRVSH